MSKRRNNPIEIIGDLQLSLGQIFSGHGAVTREEVGVIAENVDTAIVSLNDYKDSPTTLENQVNSLELTGFANWNLVSKIFEKESINFGQQQVTSKKKIDKKKTGKRKPQVDSPSFDFPDLENSGYKIKVGTILDPFSEKAFSYEWINVPLTLKDWREQILECQLVFVESAWEGNRGEWKYQLTGQSAPRVDIVEMIEFARKRGIPTVFWNKEDPPHFKDFIETAKLFDRIYTSDSNKIEEYSEALGHSNVGVLRFAAQKFIHNPARPGKVLRTGEVAFGGMYFAHKYPERREQMDYLLPAASNFKLDIFSRQLGGDPNYQFPVPYEENVVGSLSYEEMLTAYHGYKVFLNVNSVTNSPTMCARRIFEIQASGGAVVSPASPAIDAIFSNDELCQVTNEAEAKNAIRTLLQPGGFRERLVHRAQRKIWDAHTYTHRVEQIFSDVGIKTTESEYLVSVIAPTIRPENVDLILSNVARQKYKNIELIVTLHGFFIDESIYQEKAAKLGINNLIIKNEPLSMSLGNILNMMVSTSSGDVISKMDDDDFYGENYLSDLLNALEFSRADIVGKAAAHIFFESKNATILSYESFEHRYTDFVRGATLTGKRSVFERIPFEDRTTGEDSAFLKSVIESGGRIYAADRFNFVIRRNADKAKHTWSADDETLFATGPVVTFGPSEEFVSV